MGAELELEHLAVAELHGGHAAQADRGGRDRVADRRPGVGGEPEPGRGSNVYCFVEAGHIPFQPGVLEKAFVSVRLADVRIGAACAAAKAVATAVWPKLPSP